MINVIFLQVKYIYIGWLFEPSKIPEVTKLSLLSDKKNACIAAQKCKCVHT